eukprot:5619999-Amphidinium_carterae.1
MEKEVLQVASAESAKKLLTKVNPWGAVNGPCSAHILIAARIGWTIHAIDQMIGKMRKAGGSILSYLLVCAVWSMLTDMPALASQQC